jgi:choline dehydrogenase-like flavoprotein
LSGQLDDLGVPRVALHWKKFPLDLATVQKTAQRFGTYLAKTNAGRLRLDPWVLGGEAYPEDGELAGHHHMGGTRMAETPSEGVVDRNCKVFGQENLYVAGSSVFPSSGHANPTMTIVQLALRLAQHLD